MRARRVRSKICASQGSMLRSPLSGSTEYSLRGGDRAARLAGPILQRRQRRQIDIAGQANHLLARTGSGELRLPAIARLAAPPFEPLEPRRGRLAGQRIAQALSHFGQRIDTQRPANAALGPQQVHRHRRPATFDILEQQSRPVGISRRIGRRVGAGMRLELGDNLGQFQFRIDLRGDAHQLSGSFQFFQKIGKRSIRHAADCKARPRKAEARRASPFRRVATTPII